MANMFFEELDLEGAYLITSFQYDDYRGSFVKNYEKNMYEQAGITFSCSEDFISTSKRGVIRGLHFQLFHPQKKIVSVIKGEVWDVIVDLRKNSNTFGQWRGYYLSEENRKSLFIPDGFAHGFIALSDNCMVSYKCDGEYDAHTDTGIIFNDQTIAIDWPKINGEYILGERDKSLMTFENFVAGGGFIY